MTDTPVILSRGDVYSSADPFATAITFVGPTVSWVGEDEAAAVTTGEHIDLDGDLVAPGFVHAGLRLTGDDPDPAALLAAGITTVHVLGASAHVKAFAAAAPAALAIVDYRSDADGERAAIAAADLTGTGEEDRSLFITVDDEEQLAAVLSILSDPAVRTRAQRRLWRLHLDLPVPADSVEALAGTGIGITLDPAAHAQPLAPLLSAGAQVSFALDAAAPWDSLAAAVYRTEAGISARAAFNAATRFGFRALGAYESGTLAPGAEATAVRWRVGELIVQVADERLAAWSTDPRSGTPGLPDLTGSSPLPTVAEVWVRGQRAATGASAAD